MTNRVLLDVNGLKVSQPGVDVLTAPNWGLHFSSDWSAVSELITGEVYLPPNAATNVWFGKSFTNGLPLVSIYRRFPSSWISGWTVAYLDQNAPTWGSLYALFPDRLYLAAPAEECSVKYYIWNFSV